jgi:hypothetical protein
MAILRGIVLGLVLLDASCGPGSPPARPPEAPLLDLHGRLLDENGAPVEHIAVMMDLGRQRFDLGFGHSVWLAAVHRVCPSAADGSFAFPGVPADARVHLISLGLPDDHGPTGWTERACVVRGTAGEMSRQALDLRLKKPNRTVRGEIVAPETMTRVDADSGDGYLLSAGHREKASGAFTLEGLMPGDARLLLQRGNYVLESRSMTVPPDQDLDLGRIPLPRPDLQKRSPSEVNAGRVRIVGPDGRALPGFRFTFSTAAADARGETDEKGELLLKGGFIVIGDPPFRVYLDDIVRVSDERRFFGTVAERGDTAVVTVLPMTKVRLSFQRSHSPVKELVVLSKGQEPSTWSVLENQEGSFETWLSPGRCRLLVGTIQGARIEKELDVAATDPYAVTIDLP